MLSLITGAAISGLSSIGGAIADSVQRKKEKKRLNSYQNSLDKWYQKEMSTDYLDTSQAKNTLSLISKRNKKELDAMNNTLIKSGNTDEAKVAYGSKINENYNDNITSLSAYDTAYKQAIKDRYWNTTSTIENQKNALRPKNLGSTISTLGEGIGDQFLSLYGTKSKQEKQ